MKKLAKTSPPPVLAAVLSDGQPPTVLVYLDGHKAMLGSLVAVLRAVGALAGDLRTSREEALRAVLAFSWDSLRHADITRARAALVERYKPATAARHMVALRGVLETSWAVGRLSEEERKRAAYKSGVKVETLPVGRMLEAPEVRLIINAARRHGDSAVGRRDAAIVAVGLYGGLRRAEIASLDRAGYEPGLGFPEVVGKGRKPRRVPLAPGGRIVVEAWLQVSEEPAKRARQAALFPRASRGGSLRWGSRISPSGVGEVVASAVLRAGFAVPTTPHDLRRTYASTLLDLGVDLAAVQRLMGHKDPATTARYDRRPAEKDAAAAELLDDAWR